MPYFARKENGIRKPKGVIDFLIDNVANATLDCRSRDVPKMREIYIY